jgi:2-amino-4-hydroxy-6-hydroxymethyldihydropteridine diphosphokinase
MVDAYIGLGANLGDRKRTIHRALTLLESHPRITVVRVSSLRETQPVGGPPGQPRYLNGVCHVRTDLDPEALLDRLLATEAALGRTRAVRWEPRPIDLDLLVYGDRTILTERLTVPHPRLHERAFVLEPLCDLAPELEVPIPGGQPRSARHLLDALPDRSTMTPCSGSKPSRL